MAVTRWDRNASGIIMVEVRAQTFIEAKRDALQEARDRGCGECVTLPWRHSRAACEVRQFFDYSFPIRQKKKRYGITYG